MKFKIKDRPVITAIMEEDDQDTKEGECGEIRCETDPRYDERYTFLANGDYAFDADDLDAIAARIRLEDKQIK